MQRTRRPPATTQPAATLRPSRDFGSGRKMVGALPASGLPTEPHRASGDASSTHPNFGAGQPRENRRITLSTHHRCRSAPPEDQPAIGASRAHCFGPPPYAGSNAPPHVREGSAASAAAANIAACSANDSSIRRSRWQIAALVNPSPKKPSRRGPGQNSEMRRVEPWTYGALTASRQWAPI